MFSKQRPYCMQNTAQKIMFCYLLELKTLSEKIYTKISNTRVMFRKKNNRSKDVLPPWDDSLGNTLDILIALVTILSILI